MRMFLQRGSRKTPAPDFLGELPPELPGDYYASGDIAAFMEAASPWIVKYVTRRLNRDPDIVGDFYLHFYERVERCLDIYKERQDVPFTGYLALSVRHEFMNFIRRRRRREFETVPVSEVSLQDARGTTPTAPDLGRASKALGRIAAPLRVPLKLNFGLDLGTADLRYLVGHVGDPGAVADFLIRYERRCVERGTDLQRMSERAARLSFMIERAGVRPHSAEDHGGPGRWKRWKERILRVLSKRGRVLTRADIANVLRVNKSTVTRRIDRAISQLRAELTWHPAVGPGVRPTEARL